MSEIIDLTLDENVFDDSFIEINDNLSENILEQCLNQYSTQLEFETKIVRAEKEEGVWSRKTYKCRHGGKYEAKKKLDPTQNQDKKSACIKCNFTLNASYRKCPNLVFVNKFIEEHNHVMNINKDLQQFTQSSHKIPDNIIKEIRFYVQECHLGATVLKRILRNKFPNQDIYRQSLYDAIRKFKDSAQIKNDAITLLNRLIKLQQEDPNWYFKVDFEGIDNRLTKIFWMSPDQKRFWKRFHDVIINDNTCKINKYLMPLSVFIVIDSDHRNRIVATAVICDETISTYEWILE
ncbi:protein FAR1-RELATED SEQUENCE 5-like [Rhizophagus irregularis DAOM 181602=DAOM 197198]|nr:protein FAR1-RELATED SEQUENCE 5-like [Rhizophagus irregularis DAOM 181602=DAOM 197198]